LHIAVLDAVVDHLDVVASTVRANVGRARSEGGLGSNLGDDGLHCRKAFTRATRHQRRAFARALLATRNAHGHVDNIPGLESFAAATGVLEPLVTAVAENVSGLHEVGKEFDALINSGTGLHKKHNDAGFLQRVDELAGILEAHEVVFFVTKFRLGTLNARINTTGRSVVDGDCEAMLCHIECKVLPHNSQSVKPKL
jgi:hypothetical protein